MTIILAIDPGQTIGIAQATVQRNERKKLKFEHFSTIQVGKDLRELDRFNLLVSSHKEFLEEPLHVAIESFTLYAHKRKSLTGSDLPTVQVIGVMKYILNTHNIIPTFQSASIAKRMFPDKEILRLGYSMPRNKHCKDAMRHAITYYYAKLHRR